MTTVDRQLFLLLNADDDAHDWVIDGGQFFAAHAHWLLLVLLLVMALRRSRPLLRPIGVAALAIAFGALACELIPLAWDRPRPFERGLGVLHLPHSGSPSFPSSHATAYGALAFSFVLGSKLRWVGGVLLALAALVSLARVVVGVHYPFDIAIGAGLGGLSAVAAHALVERVSFWARSRTSGGLS
ncbi:phosphatase PAP2 family protein [Variovorax sp. J22P168]|uniref:phosphatase PAP2 family protein n=1 Tax=Variovorax jilinensis TaxID=3053513 RepID=UPI0025754C5C|nr:phosphatase PAP2 family protein [Variovorax sp. J22P168]MDM0012046.1 phosphatase PAP2 family protein [Variovorax sp. J22P168]